MRVLDNLENYDIPSGDKIRKVRPCIAAGPHRMLTIEVWHQTSGGKGANNLRDDQLVPAGIDMEACHENV